MSSARVVTSDGGVGYYGPHVIPAADRRRIEAELVELKQRFVNGFTEDELLLRALVGYCAYNGVDVDYSRGDWLVGYQARDGMYITHDGDTLAKALRAALANAPKHNRMACE